MANQSKVGKTTIAAPVLVLVNLLQPGSFVCALSSFVLLQNQVFGLTGDCILNTLRAMGLVTVR